jgi:flagellar hook assembly protein FlgD
LLHGHEGVALERISPNAASQDSTNWHSAASTVGYGTPTYQNSQFIESNASNEIDIAPQVFSPDGDGFQDVLSIAYQFAEAGYQCNVKIFDAGGNEVRDLVNNQLLSQSGQFIWDGTKDNDEKAGIGMYIIYVQVFDLKGNQKNFKRVCAVAGKRN